MQPALGDCVAQLVRDGYTRITVAPVPGAGRTFEADLPRLF
jgi:hypothetical protein